MRKPKLGCSFLVQKLVATDDISQMAFIPHRDAMVERRDGSARQWEILAGGRIIAF